MTKRLLPISLALFFLSITTLLVIKYQSPPLALSATNHIVISEIQVGGTSSTDEFVELYNPTDSAINLANWRLAKRTSSGELEDEENIINATMSGTIAAHGYFLIAHTNYDGLVTEDQTYAGPESVAANNTVLLYDNNGLFVDKVGMGTAVDNETAAFASVPANNRSIERKAQASSTADSMSVGGADVNAGNGEDTDNNSLDFVYRTTLQGTDPQNTSSALEIPALVSPLPTPVGTPDPSPSIEPTTTPNPSVEPTPVASVSPTPEPSATAEPTSTPTPTPSASPTASPSVEPSASPDVSPSVSPSPSLEPSSTPQPSSTVTPSITPTPSATTLPSPQTFFRGFLFQCTISYRSVHTSWFQFFLPQIRCSRI